MQNYIFVLKKEQKKSTPSVWVVSPYVILDQKESHRHVTNQ